MKKSQKTILIFSVSLILIILILGLIIYFGIIRQSTVDLPNNVKIAVPVVDTYSCEVVDSGTPTYNFVGYYLNGITLSKKDVNSDRITNIKVLVPRMTLWGLTRITWQVCNENLNSCNTYKEKATGGGSSLYQVVGIPSTIDLRTTSLIIKVEKPSNLLQTSYTNLNSDKATISYSFEKYGLKLLSTTSNLAGDTLCESSCDLSCPKQKIRDDGGIISSPSNSLKFRESASVLVYWNTIDYDFNSQYGATIYDGNQFCLANSIYSAKTITLQSGQTYIYPDTATRKLVDCCNGGVISTSYEDKICKNNEWEVISKDDKLRCKTDYNCPKFGKSTCQNKLLGGWSCSGKDSLGKYCVEESETPVECCSSSDCPTDQTCQDNTCVGGKVQSPVDLTGTEAGKTEIKLNCKWYQSEGTHTDYGFAFWRFFLNAEKTTPVCVTSWWVYLIMFITILLIIITFLMIVFLILKKIGSS